MVRRWLALALVVAALASCNSPSQEVAVDDEVTASSGEPQTVPGAMFDTVEVRITGPDGEVCTACFWRADTSEERARGLMEVTDLGGAAGMVFVFDGLVDGEFWMRDTLLPLTITFHDDRGRHVGMAEMEPCPDAMPDAGCPGYGADAPYQIAVEVPSGASTALGLVPGSTVEILGSCDLEP
jgi:uncharacterized membrane protein (UPF0127 family)